MANIAPANFAYVNANGDKGDVQVLSDADITLLNKGLQDIEDLKLAVQKPLPAGTVIPFAGNVIPEGFLICNGAAVSRTTYASLFAAIGTLYGAGDGSTTFALPDYRDRVLQGASSSHAAGTYIAAGLPNITGFLVGNTFCNSDSGTDIAEHFFWGSGQAFTYGLDPWPKGADSVVRTKVLPYNSRISFNASDSNQYYGSSSTIQPLASSIQYLIKY